MSWILVEILKLGLVNILNFKFSRDGDVWLRLRSKCLVEILKMKFDQDLCLKLWYDPIGYFGKLNSTLGSVVPLAMFLTIHQDRPSTYPFLTFCAIKLPKMIQCFMWRSPISILPFVLHSVSVRPQENLDHMYCLRLCFWGGLQLLISKCKSKRKMLFCKLGAQIAS